MDVMDGSCSGLTAAMITLWPLGAVQLKLITLILIKFTLCILTIISLLVEFTCTNMLQGSPQQNIFRTLIWDLLIQRVPFLTQPDSILCIKIRLNHRAGQTAHLASGVYKYSMHLCTHLHVLHQASNYMVRKELSVKHPKNKSTKVGKLLLNLLIICKFFIVFSAK